MKFRTLDNCSNQIVLDIKVCGFVEVISFLVLQFIKLRLFFWLSFFYEKANIEQYR